MKRLLAGLLVLVLFVAGPGQAQADYIFTTIDVPGSAQTVASGINDAGQIVGYYNGHGFLLSNGSYTTLDATGSSVTQALGINNAGQIVGSYGDASGTHGLLLSGGNGRPGTRPQLRCAGRLWHRWIGRRNWRVAGRRCRGGSTTGSQDGAARAGGGKNLQERAAAHAGRFGTLDKGLDLLWVIRPVIV